MLRDELRALSDSLLHGAMEGLITTEVEGPWVEGDRYRFIVRCFYSGTRVLIREGEHVGVVGDGFVDGPTEAEQTNWPVLARIYAGKEPSNDAA